MSVFPHKNGKGELTGKWVIEVSKGGQKFKEVIADFQEARAKELSIRMGELRF